MNRQILINDCPTSITTKSEFFKPLFEDVSLLLIHVLVTKIKEMCSNKSLYSPTLGKYSKNIFKKSSNNILDKPFNNAILEESLIGLTLESNLLNTHHDFI